MYLYQLYVLAAPTIPRGVLLQDPSEGAAKQVGYSDPH